MILKHRIEDTLKETRSWEIECIRQAEVLMKNFRFERIHLQKNWFDEMARRGQQRGSHSIGTWCPLNLFTRFHNDSLQIYWQLVFRNRLTRSIGYKHLAKTRTGGYDLRQLLGHAHDFERELVAEYEEEAQLQRLRWKELTLLNRHLARMQRRDGAEGELMRRVRARNAERERVQAQAQAQADYELVRAE